MRLPKNVRTWVCKTYLGTDPNSRGSRHVGHVVVPGENFFEVGFVRGNVDHPGEHLGVEDPRSALPASSVFMEPNMPNFGWADW
jgi:hypothetical protein